MDSLSNDQSTHTGVTPTHHDATETSNLHPNKIQKITNQQSLHTNCSINIPAFMGPQPVIHHYDEGTFLPYSPSNLQNQAESSQKMRQNLKINKAHPKNHQEDPPTAISHHLGPGKVLSVCIRMNTSQKA
jgi:hypothetical protein